MKRRKTKYEKRKKDISVVAGAKAQEEDCRKKGYWRKDCFFSNLAFISDVQGMKRA